MRSRAGRVSTITATAEEIQARGGSAGAFPADVSHGVLIFTSGGAATHPVAGWSAYCAAKAGLDHLARHQAAEFDERGIPIRTCTFYPGVVDTAMQRQIRDKSTDQFSRVGRFRRYHEEGVLRSPEEPAALIWWLSRPMATAFVGRAVSIDDPGIRRRLVEDLGIPPIRGT